MAPRFDRLKRLGAGNFGTVWLVRDPGLNTTRALKIIPKDRLSNPDNFFQEAQILKLAEHPNVVRVEETGLLDDGSVYVAMEFVKGGSLDDEASGGFVALSRVKRVMSDVLRGLEHAHAKSIMHRDVKPANILVGASGEGKLSDFGLAVPGGVDPTKIGLKDYRYLLHLAPEVANGHAHAVAADIYACGVTMYRLVNGDSFFSLPNGSDMMNMIIGGKFPDRTRYREFVPRAWRVLVNRAMNVNPISRFKSAEELRHAVESMPASVNWQEKLLTDGIEWSSGHGLRCTKVTRRQVSAKSWSIEVKRGPSKKALRRIGALCFLGLGRTEAERVTQRILQDFVLGKL
jgi:serine/threonine protein kinase